MAGSTDGIEIHSSADEINDEIQQLEARLAAAKARLAARQPPPSLTSANKGLGLRQQHIQTPQNHHFLLLLSDSALPLGSFAFSSGLESYLAHTTTRESTASRLFSSSFLSSSLSSYASTTLPFVLAAHRCPRQLAALDDQLDAAIVCTVGRRASIAQGRALLSIWERSFRSAFEAPSSTTCSKSGEAGSVEGAGEYDALETLREFSSLLKRGGNTATSKDAPSTALPPVFAHLAPLFGAVCAVMGVDLAQTAYVYLLSHVKALLSAAVRASVFGPYQAQKILAGREVRGLLNTLVGREWRTPVEEAGQSVPVMDLWIGRHELLYSRIFNS